MAVGIRFLNRERIWQICVWRENYWPDGSPVGEIRNRDKEDLS